VPDQGGDRLCRAARTPGHGGRAAAGGRGGGADGRPLLRLARADRVHAARSAGTTGCGSSPTASSSRRAARPPPGSARPGAITCWPMSA
jgi:hypothetical protein